MLQAIRNPTLAVQQQGLAEIDWSIQSTMATRHVSSVRQQSATVVLQPKRGNKIMFEATKADIKMMLDKLNVFDQFV